MAWCFHHFAGIHRCRCVIWKTGCVSNLSAGDPCNANTHLDCDLYSDSLSIVYKHKYTGADTNSHCDANSGSNFKRDITICESDSTFTCYCCVDIDFPASRYRNSISHKKNSCFNSNC